MTTFTKLMAYCPEGHQLEDWEVPMIQQEITRLGIHGWTEEEVISKLRWLEHVNPSIAEDVALRNMRLVDERVAARLASTKV